MSKLSTLDKLLRVVVALPAILFVVMGLRWLIDPAGAALALGMTLLDGLGRSSQMGDTGAYFLTLGAMILLALTTAKRRWFYAPAVVLLVTAVYRLIAWLVHDAALAVQMIGAEVVIASLLLLVASRLSEPA